MKLLIGLVVGALVGALLVALRRGKRASGAQAPALPAPPPRSRVADLAPLVEEGRVAVNVTLTMTGGWMMPATVGALELMIQVVGTTILPGRPMNGTVVTQGDAGPVARSFEGNTGDVTELARLLFATGMFERALDVREEIDTSDAWHAVTLDVDLNDCREHVRFSLMCSSYSGADAPAVAAALARLLELAGVRDERIWHDLVPGWRSA